MKTNDEINYNKEKEQAMLDVINQLDLRDNPHGINDVIAVLAEFWNRGIELANKKALADFCKELGKKSFWIFDTVYYPMEETLVICKKDYLALKRKHGIKE